MKKTVLHPNDYAPYCRPYIDAIDESVDLFEELEISLHAFIRMVREIPMELIDYRYAPGKWSIKDIIQHLIDSERVFAYRALRIGRGDTTPLAGFDENDYADDAMAHKRTINELLSEFSEVRFATLSLFRSFGAERMQRRGTASGHPVTTAALGFMILGHQKHHQKIYRERYLS